MRCKNCDYALWNLKARQCPECGTPFRPGDYQFVPNTVRFCCPQCSQAYYGTGRNGHVEPAEFACVSCGAHVHLDSMVLLPAEGVAEERTRADRMPWLERKTRGSFKAWFATVGQGLITPGRLVRSVPPKSSVGQAWWFAILTTSLFVLTGWTAPPVFIGAMMAMFGGRDPTKPMLFGVIAFLVIESALLVLLALWGPITHLVLKVTGGSSGGLGRTYQALCYSAGAAAVMAVPIIGVYPFGFVPMTWWVVSAVLMVSTAHRLHGGRAALATLAFPVGLLLLGVMAIFGLAFLAVGQARSAGSMFSRQAEVQALTAEVLGYARAHEGLEPGHASLLVTSSNLATANFVMFDSATAEADVPVGETTLDEFAYLGPNRQRMAAEAAAERLPDGVIAHRLGDFVFTYHGLDLNNADPGLWIVVGSPDPEVNVPSGVSTPVTVGLAGGSGQALFGDFMRKLAAQNALRARFGLPPLPDPATVTHDRPAVREEVISDQ